MKKETKRINHKDSRGLIRDILINEPIEHVTYIFTKKNVVRGNHYHKKTVQYVFVLEGKIEYHFVSPSGHKGKIVLKPGDLVKTPANEKHAMRTIKDTKMVVLTSGVRGGGDYEKDTYRLTNPIVS